MSNKFFCKKNFIYNHNYHTQKKDFLAHPGKNELYMPIYAHIWLYGYIWSYMTIYGKYMVIYDYVGFTYGYIYWYMKHIWSYMTMYGAYMTICAYRCIGLVWIYMEYMWTYILCEQYIWLCTIIYSHIW